eukprot:CAMPEP_0171472336 /NCGR_PEP_ID=MMETSP0946-20130122/1215_1 /TAXON_ID=109269 /ORGANISM="Vaucheria litorea, Strain CCMP2940" /LENGTH=139 /DNA_ID=CAMNT_0012001949 /DNA_START=177 /DNA_END=599 /DNA_ORIENTATION=+
MKEKKTEKLSALRNIRAAFLKETKAENSSGDSLSDDKCQIILRKLSKMRQESIDMYKKGGRMEMALKEQLELDLISSYLPKLADESTIEKWVDETISSISAKGPSDMGKVMGKIMASHKNEMDGKMVQKIVSEKLKNLE